MENVTIVIPAYNEEEAIASVLTSIHALPIKMNILVVDDASTDRTGEIAREHGAQVFRRSTNGGYGRSVKDALPQIATDIVVVIDADGTYPAEKIPQLLEKLMEGFDMVVGARHGKAYRGNFPKMPARLVFRWMVEFITNRHIPDINSGLRVFRRDTLQPYLHDICDGFSFLTTITLIYLLTGKTIAYIPIEYHRRIGQSKVRIIRDSLRTLQYIIKVAIKYKPQKLLLSLGILLVSFAAVCYVFTTIFGSVVAFFASVVIVVLSCTVLVLGFTMFSPTSSYTRL